VQEFDDIYDKKLAKKYAKYEIQRLSKRIDRKRDIGAGRPFKMDLRDRFLMLLVYYRLYITYTLYLVFSLIWIKAPSAEIFKRLRN
jgi:hypothetical protein